MTDAEMEALHKKSSNHRAEMELIGKYACFYCKKRRALKPEQDWADNGQTLFCECMVDACLPDDGTITDEMLEDMREYWFDKTVEAPGKPSEDFSEELKAKMRAAFDDLMRASDVLPMVIQDLDDAGNPVGEPMTTWSEVRARRAAEDPIGTALKQAAFYAKHASDLLRNREGRTEDKEERDIRLDMIQAETKAASAVRRWEAYFKK